MKKLTSILLLLSLLLLSGCSSGCSQFSQTYDIVATTLPVFDFTSMLCEGTELSVGRLITENVSCLHDYTLQVSQMRMIEGAEMVVISGAGLEDFLDDALVGSKHIVDASVNAHIHSGSHHHDESDHHDDHEHEHDPHIWLSAENAKKMITVIYDALAQQYPQHIDTFQSNYTATLNQLQQLQEYGESELSDLSCRGLITFHDGFAYFAEAFDLTILKSIEEESGSEASAAEIIQLVHLVQDYCLPAVFTEVSGSTACAQIVSKESGVTVYALDMAMSGDSYFDAMYHNIDTIKEALK